jgi:hypothetical protein
MTAPTISPSPMLSATEIRLTADYMLPPFNVVDEDEGE